MTATPRTPATAMPRRLVLAGALALPAAALSSCGIIPAVQGGRRKGGAGDEAVVPPPGVGETIPYLPLSGEADTADSAVVVDVYLDYLCPWCKKFETVHGEDLKALASEKGVAVRMHVRPMLDSETSPEGYSGRAANAATAVWAESPAAFWALNAALFDKQPAEGSAGLTDEELIGLAHAAGASDAVDEAITSGRHLTWLERTVEADARAKGYGTPVVEIDGTQLLPDSDELLEPEAVRRGVEQAR